MPDPALRNEDGLDRIALALADDAKPLLDVVEREAVRDKFAAADLALRGQREGSLHGRRAFAARGVERYVVADGGAQIERDWPRIKRQKQQLAASLHHLDALLWRGRVARRLDHQIRATRP